MIVIQRCHYEPDLESGAWLSANEDGSTSSAGLGSISSALLSLTGRNLRGREISWVICDRHLRSLSFPNQKVVVSSKYIERFIVSLNSSNAFTLWLQSAFPIPTRVSSPSDPKRIRSSERQEDFATGKLMPVQNMEIGSVFGTIPLSKVTAAIRHFGYLVDECTWDEFVMSHRE